MNPTNPRFNQLLKAVRQPQWIAALLSLGFHVVLFAAGPSFSSLSVAALGGTDPNGEERQVPLLELTPDEQSRLPDFSAPAYSLLPEGGDDLFSLFPPSGDSLPLDSDSAFGSPLSIPAPRLPYSPFPTGISPNFGSSPSIVIPPRTAVRPIAPGTSGQSSRVTPPDADSAADPEPETPTADPDSTPGSAADLSPEGSGTENGTSGESAPLTEPPAADRASDLLARVEYSDAQTGADEVEIAKAAWRQNVKETLGADVAEVEEPIILPVTTPGRVCLSPEPTDGLLGLVAVPNEAGDGLELFTSVLKSTGYPLLNQRAEQALRGLEQPTDAEEGSLEPNTLYQVVLDVDYDSQTCVRSEALLRSRMADEQEPETPVE